MTIAGNGAREGASKTRMTPRLAGAAMAVSALVVSGCTGPTYGTGTPAEQQLLEDISGALSLAPKKSPPIDYTPRPGIVKPPSTEVLPPPQENVASTSPSWPESPEERLARIRAEATANQNNPFYRPNVIRDDVPTTATASADTSNSGVAVGESVRMLDSGLNKATTGKQSEEFRRRQQIARQGDPTQRRYLSDPPTEYRQPAATAPAGELGEDEAKKERAKRAAASSGSGGVGAGLRKLIPWLD